MRLIRIRREFLGLLALLVVSCTEIVPEDVAIPAGRENVILGLFEPVRLGDVLPGGYRWDGLSIGQAGFTATLVPTDGEASTVQVKWEVRAGGVRVATERTVMPDLTALSGPAREGVEHLSGIIQSRLDARVWNSLLIRVDGSPFVQRTEWTGGFAAVAGLAALILLSLSLVSRPRRQLDGFSDASSPSDSPIDAVSSSSDSRIDGVSSSSDSSIDAASSTSDPSVNTSELSTDTLYASPSDPPGPASDETKSSVHQAPGRGWGWTTAAVAIGSFPFVVFSGLRLGLAATQRSISESLEALFVTGMFAGALLACGALLIRELVTAVPRVRSGAWRRMLPLAVDVVVVAGWSLIVRLGLTATNILTDGGSGWARLLGYSSGYSGLSVLVKLIRPDRPMLDAIIVPQVLAGLTPPLLVLIARELGFGRVAGLVAGLALASLPVHAAMYSSDFGTGAVLSLLLLGLWMLLRGRRLDDVAFQVGGLLVIAWGIWGRPEAIVIGLPVLAVLLPQQDLSRPLRWHPAIPGGLVWLACSALVRLDVLLSFRTNLSDAVRPAVRALWSVLVDLPSPVLTPWWLILALPVAVFVALLKAPLFITSFAIFALAPLALWFPGEGNSMESVRYGTALLVLLAFLSGAGWEQLARFATEWRDEARKKGKALRMARLIRGDLLIGIVVVAMMATPIIHRDYLSRIYGPTFEHRAFTSALQKVAEGCLVVVPDDLDTSRDGAGTMEIFARYDAIAKEAHAAGVSRVDSAGLVGATQFLREPIDRECVLFFGGVSCVDGGPMEPVTSCDDMARRFELEPVASFPTEYFSHRIIARPNHREPPLYDPDFALTLFRVIGERKEGGPANAPESKGALDVVSGGHR